jgi:CDGSH-type Zn-finger protein
MSEVPRVTVTVTVDGPYVVSGDVPVVRRRIAYSEHGEPMTWQPGVTLAPPNPVVTLCRCGGSATKPFCDGSHASNGFDGATAAPAGSYEERQRTYNLTGMVMRDDRSICVHAGFCGNRLTNVWKMAKADATEDSIARMQLMAMIERCPSGALTYRLEPDGADVEPPLRSEAVIVEDGPIALTGGITVELPDGTTLEARNRQTLCRCGGSGKKPLCDGSHKKLDFRDA